MEFLIILGLMVGCGVLLSPFYLIGRKKRARLAQEAKEEKPTMSKMKSVLYLAIEAVLCIAFFLEEVLVRKFRQRQKDVVQESKKLNERVAMLKDQ